MIIKVATEVQLRWLFFMDFVDLYHLASNQGADFIAVESLRLAVKASHATINDVYFWACKLDKSISFGHMILYLDRSSPYDDQYIEASIRFDENLPSNWVRFVCAKELMHVFDSPLEKTNNKEKFLTLMDELENNPISVDQSSMFKSERNAEWMALLALCPVRLRDKALSDIKGGKSEKEVAESLRIPQLYVSAILGDNYMKALAHLT